MVQKLEVEEWVTYIFNARRQRRHDKPRRIRFPVKYCMSWLWFIAWTCVQSFGTWLIWACQVRMNHLASRHLDNNPQVNQHCVVPHFIQMYIESVRSLNKETICVGNILNTGETLLYRDCPSIVYCISSVINYLQESRGLGCVLVLTL